MSAGVVIGGAVGGVVFFIIVLLVLSVLLCIKYSRTRKGFYINTQSSFSRPNEGNNNLLI